MASYFQGFEDDHKPEMTDNIEDFQFAKFAKEKFQADESPYSSRDVLKCPLLQLKDRNHQRRALRIWVVLLRLMVWLQEPRYLALMEEHKATRVSPLVTDSPMSKIQMIQYIIMCGIRTPGLRDEIYCQLCKQLIKNSDNQSYLKVWELLCLCCGCFPPSGNLVNYLRNFIKEGPSDYAPYCEQRLQRTIKKCSRLNPPSSLEIQATKTKKPLMLTVKFSDGMTIMITVDSATTARDLCPHIAEQISLVDQFGFMLDLHYCNQAYRLDSGDSVMDVISYCELGAVSRGEEHDTASCYLVFNKKIFAPWQILSEDLVATNLIYFQVVNRVKSGYFRYDKDENLVRLTAKQNVNDPKVKEDIVSYVRNKLTMSFSLFWEVHKVAGPGLQKDTARIAVNSTGLFVVDRKTDVNKWNGKYFIKLSFPEILSILSNRTDDMPWWWVIVTIQTVKGDQYTFTANLTQAEELKYIVETIQTPPSKQDHSHEGTTDSDDVNIAGMSRMKITAGDVMQGGEVASVVDNINKPPGELDINEGVVAGAAWDMSENMTPITIIKNYTLSGNVENLTTAPSQTINSAIENLYLKTETELDEEPRFNVTNSVALKSVLDVLYEYQFAFLVGASPLLKQTIGLACLRCYRDPNTKVLSLSSIDDNDIAAINDGLPKLVFLDEVFGFTNLNENRFNKVIDVLKKVNHNTKLLFTLTPFAYNSCRNRLNKLVSEIEKIENMVIDLDSDKDKEFDEETKLEIICKVNSLVAVKSDRNKLSEAEIEVLTTQNNPIFLECCCQFLELNRYDVDIPQWFAQPMDSLVKELLCLKEEFPRDYHVLVLIALCPQFNFSINKIPQVMLDYMALSNHKFELNDIKVICSKFCNSYLQEDFQFRFGMYRNAILGLIDNKEFLLANCPLSFLIAMDAIFIYDKFYREEHFSLHKYLFLLAGRCVIESQNDNLLQLTNLKFWNSESFMEIYNIESQRVHPDVELEELEVETYGNEQVYRRQGYLVGLTFLSVCAGCFYLRTRVH